MTVLDTGDVAAKQAGALLDVALGEFFFFAQSAKPVTDNHGVSILQLVKVCKKKLLAGSSVSATNLSKYKEITHGRPGKFRIP